MSHGSERRKHGAPSYTPLPQAATLSGVPQIYVLLATATKGATAGNRIESSRRCERYPQPVPAATQAGGDANSLARPIS
jgi:hypothetical protein